ncbi:MAG: RNA polymerase sigma factor RpoH [Rhodospirillales bacterium]|nr:RNA polymerase sigma factor RpoH [Rhodospirillales bacterium]
MTTSHLHLMASPEGNLPQFLRQIHQYPLLEAGEELELARRWLEHKDEEAAHRLVSSHMRLIAKTAMGFRGYGLPLGDLISEGNVGMMQAINRFDPDRGFRLSTYAVWWIRAAIQEYILHSWSMVKIGTTASQKKLFFNLRKIKGQMKAIEEGDLSPDQVSAVAEKLSVTESEVIKMNRRLSSPDPSLNVTFAGDGMGEWQDILVDESPDQESLLGNMEELDTRRRMLAGALKELSDRERHIVTKRHLQENPLTLEHLSRHYGISRERVRQIEARAVAKIKESVQEVALQSTSYSSDLPFMSGQI